MLHVLRKRTAKTTASARGVFPSAEFLAHKSKLALVRRNLQHATARMATAEQLWALQLAAQRGFAEDFCDGYAGPPGDDTHALMDEFARGATARYDHFVRATKKEDAAFARMHAQLRVYLGEVAGVEGRYEDIVDAKSEVARYQGKVDDIALGRRGGGEARKTRNLQKLDKERARYAELVKDVVRAQKKTIAKAEAAHRLALCAYWSAHARHVAVMEGSLEATAEWARGAAPALREVDVAALDPDVGTEALAGVGLRSPHSDPGPSVPALHEDDDDVGVGEVAAAEVDDAKQTQVHTPAEPRSLTFVPVLAAV